ncbi:hypothetical protein [Paenibacillus sp. HB172176]|uniref:hypothetical protein n=1 Tax=Paenibacillus sp. HB172176 TaxID=2493690 RepID=UPI0014392DA8|nr:hypothetical protein [Paenibacillus sp. HB172176]
MDDRNFVRGKWVEEFVSHSVERIIDPVIIIDDVRAHIEQLDPNGSVIIEKWTGASDDNSILNH